MKIEIKFELNGETKTEIIEGDSLYKALLTHSRMWSLTPNYLSVKVLELKS